MFWRRYEALCMEIGIAPTSKRARNLFGISSVATIQNWKTNGTTPDMKTLRRMAEVFNTSVSYLAGENPGRPRPREKKGPAPEDAERGKNIMRILGRDGSFVEKVLSDGQLMAYQAMINLLPDNRDGRS